MICTLKIKLKTPFLGSQRTPQKVRKFRKTKEGDIQLDSAQWSFVIGEAVDNLGMDVNPEAVRLPLHFACPRLSLYTRRWTDSGGPHTEEFEAIPKGAVLSIQVVSLRKSEGNIQPGPDADELRLIFEFVGAWIGLSPWGSKFNYGRFDVLKLTTDESDTRRGPFSDTSSR